MNDLLDPRSSQEKDRDKILHSDEFRRLAGVTQVTSAVEIYSFHNRLTHSLKVAQIAKAIVPVLNSKFGDQISKIGGIDLFCVEAAALAHDLGHPPFGHVAEYELNRLAQANGLNDGFEGNAQSFRIVTKISTHKEDSLGLGLSDKTLNAILKYPWLYQDGHDKRSKKWGSYHTEKDILSRIRTGMVDGHRTIEAEIMDFADDITYSIYDLEDFYRCGLIPIGSIIFDADEREKFSNFSKAKLKKHFGLGFDEDLYKSTEYNFLDNFMEPYLKMNYDDSIRHRSLIKELMSHLITKYINSISIQPTKSTTEYLIKSIQIEYEIEILKNLTRFYIIESRRLATLQQGQRKIISDLYSILSESLKDDFKLFPTKFRSLMEDYSFSSMEQERIVLDIICSLSDAEAVRLHKRLTGIEVHSILENY